MFAFGSVWRQKIPPDRSKSRYIGCNLVCFWADQQETDQKLQVGVAAEDIFRDFRDFLEKSHDHEKSTNFSFPDTAIFVIVTFETITLLTRGLSPAGQNDDNEQPTICARLFYDCSAS